MSRRGGSRAEERVRGDQSGGKRSREERKGGQFTFGFESFLEELRGVGYYRESNTSFASLSARSCAERT